MTVLGEEYGKHAWTARNVAVRSQSGELGDVLLGVVLTGRQFTACGIAVGFSIGNGNLDVNHLVMGLDDSFIGRLALGVLDVDEEILALNLVLTRFDSLQVVVLQPFHDFRKQRIDRCIVLQIFKCVNNHNAFVFIG